MVFVLGGPGSGKGTNCVLIKEKFGYVHLSAGDLLRAERESGSELATLINNYITSGTIVPAEITVRLLRQAMEKASQQSMKFLVDGFPRDLANLECWEKDMNEVADINFLLFIDCPTDVMVDRLLERGKTSGRNDDNIDTIKKRLVTYEEQTKPIIERFREMGKIQSIDSNRSQELVSADVEKLFSSLSQ